MAPITGGASTPPVEAVASTAADCSAVNPMRFIIGMVTTPVDMMLLTGEPVTLPIMPEAATAIFAGPPRRLPISAMAVSVKNCVAPLTSISLPNTTKASTTEAMMLTPGREWRWCRNRGTSPAVPA